MSTRERMKDALRERGYSKAQIHDVELLSQGFEPEGGLDLVAVWHAHDFLIKNGDSMEAKVASLDAERKMAESKIAGLQSEVDRLTTEKMVAEMQREEVLGELLDCQRELSKEKARTEYYRQKTEVNSLAMKVMDRVYMPVYNFLNLPNVRTMPIRVMGNMPVSGDMLNDSAMKVIKE